MIHAELTLFDSRWLYTVTDAGEVLEVGELTAAPISENADLVLLLRPRFPSLTLGHATVLRGPAAVVQEVSHEAH